MEEREIPLISTSRRPVAETFGTIVPGLITTAAEPAQTEA